MDEENAAKTKWAFICDKHNDVMSIIINMLTSKKAKSKKCSDIFKKLDTNKPEGIVELIDYIKKRIGGFEQFDVNVSNPSSDMLHALSGVLVENQDYIKAGFKKRE